MSAIFLSHSSADSEIVAELKEWLLETHKHRSVFLDFDPEVGIPAGRDWEAELYRQLGACRAVIALCSEASMSSRWCFAEIALARSMGKPVFPILVEPCEVFDVLRSVQIIKLEEGRTAAWQRLSRALKTAGLHSADLFGWNAAAGRPPYPGLAPFEAEDAGVFFGRDLEIGEGLERLNQIRRHQGAGMLLVLGGSGSGKSSLVKAGLVPRLRLDSERWVVLTPARLGSEPHRTLARVVAESLREPSATDTATVLPGLEGEAPIERRAEALSAMVREIQGYAEQPNARVLLVLDQFEELLQQPEGHPAHDLLSLLRLAIDREGAPLVVMATMRSDFLGEFLQHEALKGLTYGNLTLGPMSAENLRQIVELPAQLAAIQVEDRLVDVLLQDADTDYALPLLAFTLRELYDGFIDESNRVVELHHYRDLLGGIEGAIKKAVDRRLPPALTEEQEEALRRAFLALMRLDGKGRVSRRTASWSEIEGLMGGREQAEQLLGPFVDGLLLRPASLAGGERAVEVTHEAVFSNWDQLNRWIHEHADELKLRDRLVEAADHWLKGGRRPDDLLTQRARLAPALDLLSADRVPLSNEVREFIETSEVEIERIETRGRRLRQSIQGAVVLVALVMAFLWTRAERAREASVRAEEEARAQVSRFLAAETERQDLDLGLLLALESYRSFDTLEARNALAAKVFERPRLVQFLHGHTDWVSHLAVAEDGASMISLSRSGRARAWNLATGESSVIGDAATEIRAMARSRDGRVLVMAYEDGSLIVGEVGDSGSSVVPRQAISTGNESVEALALSFDGKSIAAALPGGAIRFWSASTAAEMSRPIRDLGAEVRSLAFGPDGGLLAAGDVDGEMRAWDLSGESGPEEIWRRGGGGDGEVVRVAFSPVESGLMAWVKAGDSRIHYCHLAPDPSSRFPSCAAGSESIGQRMTALTDLAFSADGRYLAASGREVTGRGGADRKMMVWLWDLAGERDIRLRHGWRAVDSLAFVGDGSTLVSGSRDGKIRLWSVQPPEGLLPQGDYVDALAAPTGGPTALVGVVTADVLSVWDPETRARRLSSETGFLSRVAMAEGRIVAGGDDGVLRVWSSEAEEPLRSLELGSGISSVAIEGSGTWIAAGGADKVVRVWREGEQAPTASVRLGAPAAELALGAEAAALVAVAETGEMATWSLLQGRPEAEPSTHVAGDALTAMSIRADATLVAAATGQRKIVLWDPSTWEMTRPSEHPVFEHPVSSIALSPDGRYLASGSGVVHVWNLERDRLEFTIPEPEDGGEVVGLAFDARSSRLFLGRLDEVWVIPLDKNEWRERACRRANRPMSESERDSYLGQDAMGDACEELRADGVADSTGAAERP